jgi:hypothetical protein
VLHNYLRNNQMFENIEVMSENQLLPCTHTNSRSASSASVVRQKFTDYFNTVGSVLWQADGVSRGKYQTSLNSNCQSSAPQVCFTLFAFSINSFPSTYRCLN